MVWNPPPTVRLSSNDITHLVTGLTDPASRDRALTFVDTLTDPGLLRVVACRLTEIRHLPTLPLGGADDYRAFIYDQAKENA